MATANCHPLATRSNFHFETFFVSTIGGLEQIVGKYLNCSRQAGGRGHWLGFCAFSGQAQLEASARKDNQRLEKDNDKYTPCGTDNKGPSSAGLLINSCFSLIFLIGHFW